jgi:hypothetical protein
MFWMFFLVGLAVIGVLALAATGALGQIEDQDDFDTQATYVNGQRVPLALFGYRKSRVDQVISEMQTEINSLKKVQK